jgi:hypothetical protein
MKKRTFSAKQKASIVLEEKQGQSRFSRELCVLIISLGSSPAPQCSAKIIRFHHRFGKTEKQGQSRFSRELCVLIISLRSSPTPQCSAKIIRFHHRFNPLLSAVGCSFVHCIANGLKSVFLFTGVDPSEILLWKRYRRFTQRLRIATCAQLCTSPPSLFTRSYQLCSNRIPFYVFK